MAESAIFFFDGISGATAYVSGANIGDTYTFFAEGSGTADTQVAGAASLTMSITGITNSGAPFPLNVYNQTTGEWFAIGVFQEGSVYQYQFAADWTYDGADTVTCTFFAAGGITYYLYAFDLPNTEFTSVVGAGATITITLDYSPTVFAGKFVGVLYAIPPSPDYATYTARVFDQGVAGEGEPGNPSPASVGFCDRTWRFLVTDLAGETITILDHLAAERTVTPKLNEPLEVSGTVPSDNSEVNAVHADGFPFLAEGVRQVYCFRRESGSVPYFTPRASTLVLQVGDSAQSDDARSRFTAWDPWQYMFSRPVLVSALTPNDTEGGSAGSPGDLIGSGGILYPATMTADDIVLDMIQTTVAFGDPTAPPAALACFTDVTSGTLQTCTTFTDGYPIQQGTSLGQALQDMCSTGVLDLIFTPIFDPLNRPGILCELNIYSQSAPFDGAGSYNYHAVFAWDKPGRSLVGVDNLYDGAQRANHVQFYNGQGGPPVAPQTSPSSITRYGEYVAQQFFPAETEPAAVIAIAAEQLALRSSFKETLTVNPAPERSPEPFTGYYLGDRVPVFVSDNMRQSLVGWQRVYGIPVSIDDSGVETVRELLVGPIGAPPPVAAPLLSGGDLGTTVAVDAAARRASGGGVLTSPDGVQA